jgi:predicted unusual protein kinase regulating ubiquinone biosynthesis (AarF/ABC1/UbiB family)
MSNILDEESISKIHIKMGHLTGSKNYPSFPRGITAYIYNTTELSNKQLSQLKSLFQISQDKRFEMYLPS